MSRYVRANVLGFHSSRPRPAFFEALADREHVTEVRLSPKVIYNELHGLIRGIVKGDEVSTPVAICYTGAATSGRMGEDDIALRERSVATALEGAEGARGWTCLFLAAGDLKPWMGQSDDPRPMVVNAQHDTRKPGEPSISASDLLHLSPERRKALIACWEAADTIGPSADARGAHDYLLARVRGLIERGPVGSSAFESMDD